MLLIRYFYIFGFAQIMSETLIQENTVIPFSRGPIYKDNNVIWDEYVSVLDKPYHPYNIRLDLFSTKHFIINISVKPSSRKRWFENLINCFLVKLTKFDS